MASDGRGSVMSAPIVAVDGDVAVRQVAGVDGGRAVAEAEARRVSSRSSPFM